MEQKGEVDALNSKSKAMQIAWDLTKNSESSSEDGFKPETPPRRGRKRKRTTQLSEDAPETEEEEHKRVIANSQERCRMDKLNKALEDLRKCLPQQFHLYNRRMSKIRTLRLAMRYMATLSDMISTDDSRREEVYQQTLIAAQSTPSDVGYFSQSDMTSPYTAVTMTPGPANSYHPYYTTLFDLAGGSMYQTPPAQTPPRPQLQPRHLHFYPTTPTDEQKMISADVLTRGTPTLTGRGYFTPSVRRESRRRIETISSPPVGSDDVNQIDVCCVAGAQDRKTLSVQPVRGFLEERFHSAQTLSRRYGVDADGSEPGGYRHGQQRDIP